MRVAIGVDPGLEGAIAVITADQALVLFDMPKVESTSRTPKGNVRLELDVEACVERIEHALALADGGELVAAVEATWAAQGQSGASLASAARNGAIIEGIIAAQHVRCGRPQSSTWKRRAGLLHQDKDAARALAAEHFPELAHVLTRKKDDGRAEALLIAEYAWAQAGWEEREAPAQPFK